MARWSQNLQSCYQVHTNCTCTVCTGTAGCRIVVVTVLYSIRVGKLARLVGHNFFMKRTNDGRERFLDVAGAVFGNYSTNLLVAVTTKIK